MTDAVARRQSPLATDPVFIRGAGHKPANEREPAPLAERPVSPDRAARARALVTTVPLTAAWVVIACALASALFPQLIAPYTPTAMDSNAILQPPLGAHMLGTDQFGRDVLSLVIFGARESLLLAAAAVLLSCSTGVAIGLIAGYTGGVVDLVLMRIIDVWMAIPNILLAIAICTARGPSTESTILAISVVMVARYARVLRGQALAVRSRPFILAARAAGASHLSILRRHVLPHCFAPVLVMATLGVGTSILLGASLSFLGLGVNDERPDWGYLLTQGRGYLTVAWWTVTYPGLAITLLCVSINLLGDALRRKLEPRRDGNKP